jgi:MarR family transcriptional regulator, transcriptional regulator for hemolysin
MSDSLVLFDLLGQLSRRRFQQGERAFASLGLNHTEARLLSLLRQAGGVAGQEELAAQLSVDRTNCGRALRQLEEHGYVQRKVDNTDKRARLVQLTRKGRNTVNEIVKVRQRMAAGFFAALAQEEASTLRRLLEKIVTEQ